MTMSNKHQASGLFVAFITVALFLPFKVEVFAQQGRLMGRVQDSSGKPVAGATIYITCSSVTQAAVSNAQGYYTFLNVPPETYKIRTYKRGYSTWNSDLTVAANSITRIDVKLGIGETEENIVVAEAKKNDFNRCQKDRACHQEKRIC
jgi:hypothetical protein